MLAAGKRETAGLVDFLMYPWMVPVDLRERVAVPEAQKAPIAVSCPFLVQSFCL